MPRTREKAAPPKPKGGLVEKIRSKLGGSKPQWPLQAGIPPPETFCLACQANLLNAIGCPWYTGVASVSAELLKQRRKYLDKDFPKDTPRCARCYLPLTGKRRHRDTEELFQKARLQASKQQWARNGWAVDLELKLREGASSGARSHRKRKRSRRRESSRSPFRPEVHKRDCENWRGYEPSYYYGSETSRKHYDRRRYEEDRYEDYRYKEYRREDYRHEDYRHEDYRPKDHRHENHRHEDHRREDHRHEDHRHEDHRHDENDDGRRRQRQRSPDYKDRRSGQATEHVHRRRERHIVWAPDDQHGHPTAPDGWQPALTHQTAPVEPASRTETASRARPQSDLGTYPPADYAQSNSGPLPPALGHEMPRSNSLSVVDMYAHQPLPPLPAGAPLPHPAARPATVRISNDEELAAWASETQQAPNDHSYADGAAEEAPSNPKDVATQADSPSDSRSGSPDFDSDPDFGSDMGIGPYMHGALGGSTLHVNEGYLLPPEPIAPQPEEPPADETWEAYGNGERYEDGERSEDGEGYEDGERYEDGETYDDEEELDPTERYYPDTAYRIPFMGGRSSAYCWFDQGSPYQRFTSELDTVLEVEEPPFEAESCTKPLEHLLRRVKARVSRASTLESEPAPDPIASDSAPQPLQEDSAPQSLQQEAAPRDAIPELVPVQPLQRSATVTGASSHEQSQQDPDPDPIPRSQSSLDFPGAVGTNSSSRKPMASQIPRPRPVLSTNARQQSQSQPAPAPEPSQSQIQPRVQQTQQVMPQPRQPVPSTPARAPAPAPAPASRHQAPAASAPGPAPPAPARPPRPVPHSQRATTASLARSNSIRQSRTEAPASRGRGGGSSGGPSRSNEQRGARQASAASSPATSGRNASGRSRREAESSGRAQERRGDSEDLDPEQKGRSTRRGHR